MKVHHYLSVLLLTGSLSLSAQNNNVQSAAMYFGYSEKSDKPEEKLEEITKAKDYIDKAAVNEQTSNSPKMWFYKGKIYLEISRNKKEEVRKMDPDAAEKSAQAFLNCLKTDTREMYKDESKDLIWLAGVGVFNKASEYFAQNQLDKAAQLYKLIFEIFPYDTKDKNLARSNITEEVLNKNLYLTAYKAKDYKTAKMYLQKLLDVNYNDPFTYVYMSRVLTHEKDTAKALEVLEKGASVFEGNKDISNEQINLLIAKRMVKELIAKYSKQIEENPDKEDLYLQRGSFFQKTDQNDKAIEDFKKALSINPNMFEANYNLGVIYFNQAADMTNKANDIKNDAEFKKAKAKADARFKECIPYFEKAREIEPKDKSTLNLLKQIYVRTGEKEKYDQVKSELEKL